MSDKKTIQVPVPDWAYHELRKHVAEIDAPSVAEFCRDVMGLPDPHDERTPEAVKQLRMRLTEAMPESLKRNG